MIKKSNPHEDLLFGVLTTGFLLGVMFSIAIFCFAMIFIAG